VTIEALAELLHETAERHDPYEQAAEPHHWWDWYAAYMVARETGSSPDEADAAANRYMAEVKQVVVGRSP
jgi:FAD/FMN-containing dehydrogenase